MEYFVGSVITLIAIVSIMIIAKSNTPPTVPSIRYSQSHIHNLIYPWIPTNDELVEPIVSQSTKHLDSAFVRVVMVDGKGYFIKDGTFFVAEVVDGDIDKSTAKQVDTMTMDTVQLNKIKFIVEKLTEGKDNDSWNAG